MNNYSDVEFYSIRKLFSKTYSGGVLKINNKKNVTPKLHLKLSKYKANTKIILSNFLENNFLVFKRFIKRKFLKMPNYTKLNSIKNEKINEDFLIDDLSKKIFFKKKFNKIKKLRYRNYTIWKKLCKKNKSVEIIKRNFNKNDIPWVFPVYVKNFEIRKKIFNFGWQNGYSVFSWPSLPNNLLNKRNKKIWNKLVCFNTDRAPDDKNINFDNPFF